MSQSQRLPTDKPFPFFTQKRILSLLLALPLAATALGETTPARSEASQSLSDRVVQVALYVAANFPETGYNSGMTKKEIYQGGRSWVFRIKSRITGETYLLRLIPEGEDLRVHFPHHGEFHDDDMNERIRALEVKFNDQQLRPRK